MKRVGLYLCVAFEGAIAYLIVKGYNCVGYTAIGLGYKRVPLSSHIYGLYAVGLRFLYNLRL